MAGVKVTDLGDLAAAPADGDFILVIDSSDTTDSADGTFKRAGVDDVRAAVLAGGPVVTTVAATGATETLSFGTTYEVTMDESCTFSFDSAPASGTEGTITVYLDGAFTPTWPAAVVWAGGSAPTYTTPSLYEFRTIDAGTTVYGIQHGANFS